MYFLAFDVSSPV